MRCFIDPNQKSCPICGGHSDIYIEDGFIFCENCTANFTDPKWADGPDEMHEVTFDSFEQELAAAEVMQKLANLAEFMPRVST